jgi:hypothetical protein
MGKRSDVEVRLDNRLRLMSAALAATDWPEKVQKENPHGSHAHARATSKFISQHRSHPAVKSMQRLLDKGAPLEAMFTFALCMRWPDLTLELDTIPGWVPKNWVDDLRDFCQKTGLVAWWEQEDTVWKKSEQESERMFSSAAFKPFLTPFIGKIKEKLIFVPNISYPSDQEIGVRLGNELLCIAAPRLAWGDSPPWPFDEDPAHVYRAALSQYGRLLLGAYLRTHADRVAAATKTALPVSKPFSERYPGWEEQFIALFVAAAVAIYLEDSVSEAEAKAYVLMARKAQGMTILPGTISVLRRYLSEHESGRYAELVDFLPIFPKQLRVAKRIVTL